MTQIRFTKLNPDGVWQEYLTINSNDVGKGLLHFLKYEVSNYYSEHVWIQMDTADTLLMEFCIVPLLVAFTVHIARNYDNATYGLRYASDALQRVWLNEQSPDVKILCTITNKEVLD